MRGFLTQWRPPEPSQITRPLCAALILALSGCGGIWKSNAGGLPLYKLSDVTLVDLGNTDQTNMNNEYLGNWPGYRINGGAFTPMYLAPPPQIDPVQPNGGYTINAVNDAGVFVGYTTPTSPTPSNPGTWPVKAGRAFLASESGSVLIPLPPGQPEIFDDVDNMPMRPMVYGLTEEGYAILSYPTNNTYANDPNVGAIWLQNANSSQLLWRRGEFPGGPGTLVFGRDGHIVYATNAEGIFVWHDGSSELAIPVATRPQNSYVLAVNGNGNILGYDLNLPEDPPSVKFWIWRKASGINYVKGIEIAELDWLFDLQVFNDSCMALLDVKRKGETEAEFVVIANDELIPLDQLVESPPSIPIRGNVGNINNNGDILFGKIGGGGSFGENLKP